MNTETIPAEEITSEDIDSWCNCYNFPFQKCDECKILLWDYYNKNKES